MLWTFCILVLHLGSEFTLIHMQASVIKLMCAFLFIAAIKEILMSQWIKLLHARWSKPEIKHKFKILEIIICFIGEDLIQVWLQYFYFEKNRFDQSKTFYVNVENRSKNLVNGWDGHDSKPGPWNTHLLVHFSDWDDLKSSMILKESERFFRIQSLTRQQW